MAYDFMSEEFWANRDFIEDIREEVDERLCQPLVILSRNNKYYKKARGRMGDISDLLEKDISAEEKTKLFQEYVGNQCDAEREENLASYFLGMEDCLKLLEELGMLAEREESASKERLFTLIKKCMMN